MVRTNPQYTGRVPHDVFYLLIRGGGLGNLYPVKILLARHEHSVITHAKIGIGKVRIEPHRVHLDTQERDSADTQTHKEKIRQRRLGWDAECLRECD